MGASDPIKLDTAGEQDSLRALSLFLQKRKGIRLLDYKERWVERRLLMRVRTTQCADVGTYVEYVRRNPDEVNRLLEALSINVSSFFRNPEVYAAIAETVFTAWRSAAISGERKLFRAWSCACAHGEEPYSLSMLWESWAAQSFPDEVRPVDLKITASDVDEEALSRARSAEYDSSVQRDLPPYAVAFFEARGGRLVVRPAVKSRVQFVCENVLAPARRPRMDLILCRNFLIFLDRDGRDAMMKIFEQALVPGGFLVLGHAETAMESTHARFAAVDSARRIYRKVEHGVRLK